MPSADPATVSLGAGDETALTDITCAPIGTLCTATWLGGLMGRGGGRLAAKLVEAICNAEWVAW